MKLRAGPLTPGVEAAIQREPGQTASDAASRRSPISPKSPGPTNHDKSICTPR